MLAKIFNEDTKELIVAIGNNAQYFLENGFSEMDVVKSFDGRYFLEGHLPPQPAAAELAANLSMTIDEFMLLSINLSALIGQPITLEQIEALIAASSQEVQIAFKYANIVKRSDPLLIQMTSSLGYPLDLLDVMFIEKDNILDKIRKGEPLELPEMGA